MRLKTPYELQTVVTDNAAMNRVPDPDKIFDSVDALMAARPECKAIAFGFRIVDTATGQVPESFEPWYESAAQAYSVYERNLDKQDTSSTRYGEVAALTQNRDRIVAARDELYRVGNLLQAVLDGKIYQTDVAEHIGANLSSTRYQIAHQFKSYIKSKLETIDDLCRELENLRTPGDLLLLHVFGNVRSGEMNHVTDTIIFLPEYDEDALWDAVNQALTPREEAVVKMAVGAFYGDRDGYRINGDKLPLAEIARLFNVTTERIRQVYAKALRKLRRPAVMNRVFPAMHAGFADCAQFILTSAEVSYQKYLSAKADYQRIHDLLAATESYRAGQMPDPEVQDRLDFVATGTAPAEAPAPIITLESLDLSVRTFNCLKRAGLDTLNKVAKLSLDDMKRVRNLGQKGVEEAEAYVKQFFGHGFRTSEIQE